MPPGRHYEFGPFRLDPVGGVLFRGGERLALRPKVVELLTMLVEAQGNPVTKNELLQKVWADAIVEEGTLASHISVLRKALGEGPESAQYIETIPKRGYRFVAPVRISENGLPQPVSDVSKPPRLVVVPRKTLLLLLASIVCLILAGVAGWS